LDYIIEALFEVAKLANAGINQFVRKVNVDNDFEGPGRADKLLGAGQGFFPGV
jgi:hypothetical protein